MRQESLGALISKTFFKMRHGLCRALHPYQVTPEQWALLRNLWEQDGISQKELSARCLKDQPTTARILDKLQERGLICRRAHPEDKRAFLIDLTQEGRDIQAFLTPLVDNHLTQALKGLSGQDQDRLRALLNKINENLDQGESHAE